MPQYAEVPVDGLRVGVLVRRNFEPETSSPQSDDETPVGIVSCYNLDSPVVQITPLNPPIILYQMHVSKLHVVDVVPFKPCMNMIHSLTIAFETIDKVWCSLSLAEVRECDTSSTDTGSIGKC